MVGAYFLQTYAANPTFECRRGKSNIHRNFKCFASDHSNHLSLRVVVLLLQFSHDILHRVRVIVLNVLNGPYDRLLNYAMVKALEEKAARVTEHP